VLTRLFGIESNPREKDTNARLWAIAEEFVTEAARQEPACSDHSKSSGMGSACSSLNQSLMELGALICTPRQPRCPACPLKRHCVARRNGCVDRLPNLQSRVAPTSRRFAAFVVENSGTFLVRQRPGGVVNAHMWEFPNAELSEAGENLAEVARRTLSLTPQTLKELCTVRHSITRYRITLNAFAVRAADDSMDSVVEGRWLTLRDLQNLPFPSAHRKVLQHLA
jgi:A/G-specific adenine glycosylase